MTCECEGKGQHAGDTAESWLSHSKTIIVYLCMNSLWAKACKRFSIEDEECLSRGELATGGWTHLKRADCHWTAQLIIEVLSETLNWEWWVGGIEAAQRFFEPSKGKAGGWWQERQNEHATCRPGRPLRLHKDPILGLRSCLASSQNPHIAIPLLLSHCKTKLELYERQAAWLPSKSHEKIRAAAEIKVGRGLYRGAVGSSAGSVVHICDLGSTIEDSHSDVADGSLPPPNPVTAAVRPAPSCKHGLFDDSLLIVDDWSQRGGNTIRRQGTCWKSSVAYQCAARNDQDEN